jgi:hypothetical protein
MSDDQTIETTETTVTEVKPGPEPAETFSKEYVQELRNEAAKYRSKVKTSVEETKAAMQAEFEAKLAAKDTELSEVTSNFSSKELELGKLRIAMRTLDQDTASRAEKLAELLKGETEEDVTASAKSAYELFGGFKTGPVPATDPSQGRGSATLPLNGDPLLASLKRIVGA